MTLRTHTEHTQHTRHGTRRHTAQHGTAHTQRAQHTHTTSSPRACSTYDRSCGQIWQSIEAMDRKGMSLIEAQSVDGFHAYLKETKNTICGRYPIQVRVCVCVCVCSHVLPGPLATPPALGGAPHGEVCEVRSELQVRRSRGLVRVLRRRRRVASRVIGSRAHTVYITPRVQHPRKSRTLISSGVIDSHRWVSTTSPSRGRLFSVGGGVRVERVARGEQGLEQRVVGAHADGRIG